MADLRAPLVAALLALALPAAARGDEPGREPPSGSSEPTPLHEAPGAAPSHLGAGADAAAPGREVQPVPAVDTPPTVTPAAVWSPVLFGPLDPQAGC